MPHDVFFSFSSDGKSVADAACDWLERRQISCWIAHRDVLPGVEYAEALLNAIGSCRVVVLIFSAAANKSAFVHKEIERAVSKEKIILTFRIEDVRPSKAMEFLLSNTHWLDALTAPVEAHFARLEESVATLLKLAKPPYKSYPHNTPSPEPEPPGPDLPVIPQVKPLPTSGRPLKSASLVFRQGDTERRILLLGSTELTAGRAKRPTNDIALRMFPRPDSDEERSTQLTVSRRHFKITLRPDGLFLADRNTIEGTYLNNERIRGEVPLPMGDVSDVGVAQALRLRLRPFLCDIGGIVIEAERYHLLGKLDEAWRMAEPHKLGSLLIERVDNLKEEQYLNIYRWAECGSAVDNEISLPGSGLKPRQFRIDRIGGKFWVEAFEDEPPLTMGGQRIRCLEACPLQARSTLSCGDWEARVEPFAQYGLRDRSE